MKKIKKLWNLLDKSHHELRKINNTLEIELSTLEQSIKDDIYIKFMKKLEESAESKRLRRDNKILRQNLKELKEELKNGENISSKSQSKKIRNKF